MPPVQSRNRRRPGGRRTPESRRSCRDCNCRLNCPTLARELAVFRKRDRGGFQFEPRQDVLGVNGAGEVLRVSPGRWQAKFPRGRVHVGRSRGPSGDIGGSLRVDVAMTTATPTVNWWRDPRRSPGTEMGRERIERGHACIAAARTAFGFISVELARAYSAAGVASPNKTRGHTAPSWTPAVAWAGSPTDAPLK